MQCAALMASALISSVEQQYAQRCFLHAMFQGGAHVLTCILYSSVIILVHSCCEPDNESAAGYRGEAGEGDFVSQLLPLQPVAEGETDGEARDNSKR